MRLHAQEPSPERSQRSGDRLDSWKEIAAYFNRDVRTVRRWEAAQGLPVLRHHHRTRSSVYAYTGDLDRWWDHGRGPGERAAAATQAKRRFGWAIAAVPIGLVALGFILGEAPGARDFLRPAASNDRGLTNRSAAEERQTFRAANEAEARALYRRGRYFLDRRMGWQRFLPPLEGALAIDPLFAPAQAAVAEGYRRVAVLDPERRQAAWVQSVVAARQALSLDPDLPAAHTTLGLIYLHRDWNWILAREELLRAIQLDPVDADARAGYATYLRLAGRSEEAIAERRRAVEAAPLKIEHLTALGTEYTFAHHYRQASAAFRDALEIEPGYLPAIRGLADAQERLGLRADEEASVRRVLAMHGPRPVREAFEAIAQREGYAAARTWLDRQELARARTQPTANLWTLAYTYARLNEKESAWKFLEAAIDQRDPAVLQMRVDPDLDPLRADPRFDGLVQRLGAPSWR